MTTVSDILVRRAASLAPSTFNRDARTVEAVLSTGAPVQRRDARGSFAERLATAPGAVSLHTPRLPILDSHRQGSVADVLGFVSAVRSDGGNIIATLTITSDSALSLIESGAVTGVSIGYRGTDWAESDGGRVRTANKWTLLEVSLVPVPADPGATLRSDPTMTTTTATTTEPATTVTPATQTRGEVNASIRNLGATLGLGTQWVDSQIDAATDLPAARSAALAEIERRSAAGLIRVQQTGPSNDDPAVMHTRMAEALAHRMNPALELSEPARQYMGLGLADHARVLLTARGETGIAYMSRETLLQRAINTGDIPNLLTASGNRHLAAAYTAAPNPLKLLAREATAADFRTRTVLRFGDLSTLDRVPEDGEVTAGGAAEMAQSYALATYAKTFNITRQAMINDDLGAFADISGAMGRAAAETEAKLLATLLNQSNGTGPTMSDNVRLFNAAHGNYGTSTPITNANALDLARIALRRQTGLDGKTPINATGVYLLVSPESESNAYNSIAYIYPTTIAAANPFTNRLEVLVEPRLTGNGWYVFADPAVLPVLEYAYLSSAPGPQMASRQGWDVLGMEFRVHLDFGCGAIDWRGAYRNTGV